ncbi:MAG: RDD family protein [Deltaproteobacteria bacterium]|nr:RDD family protein [Deltaproteobacteria bacterium]
MITTNFKIDSPEGISFSYELASLTDRGVAYLIDLAIRATVMVAFGIVMLVALGPVIFAGVGMWLIVYFIVEWGYYVLFELLWNGQSPGKRLFNLRVVKLHGTPVGFFDSLLRNLLRAADALPPLFIVGSYAFGAMTLLVSKRFQRLGDLAAGTIVVLEHKNHYAGTMSLPQLQKLDHGALGPEAALRGARLSTREKQLLAEFAARSYRLHPQRAEELASIIAAPFAKRMGRPLEGSATEFLLRLHAAAGERESSS